MKLTTLLLMITMYSYGQKSDLFAMNTSKSLNKFDMSYSPVVNKINLKLPTKGYTSSGDNLTTGVAILLAGLAFTTASILEGDSNYGTWTHTPNSTSQYNMTYKTKPFIEQTPRQIMLFVGIGLTITGGVISLK